MRNSGEALLGLLQHEGAKTHRVPCSLPGGGHRFIEWADGGENGGPLLAVLCAGPTLLPGILCLLIHTHTVILASYSFFLFCCSRRHLFRFECSSEESQLPAPSLSPVQTSPPCEHKSTGTLLPASAQRSPPCPPSSLKRVWWWPWVIIPQTGVCLSLLYLNGVYEFSSGQYLGD